MKFTEYKKTLPKAVAAFAAISCMLILNLSASNHEDDDNDKDDGTCNTCKTGDVTGKSEKCPSSFNMSLNLGFARLNRTENLLYQSKVGLQKGQGGKGTYRNFDAVRSNSFDTSNVTNRNAERININTPSITAALYHPSIIRYNRATKAEYITDSQAGYLRQVTTESGFTDISLIADGFMICIWDINSLTNLVKNASGQYTIPIVSPITEIKFKNPDYPAQNGRLLISKKENFSGSATLETAELYDQSNPDVLIVKQYQGPDTTGTLLEETTLTFSNRGAKPWDYTFEKIVKQVTNNNGVIGNLVEVSRTRETHRDLSLSSIGGDYNGKRLMSTTTAFGTPESQTASYDYYDTPNNKYLHGRLKSVQSLDGRWEYYEYTGDETSAVSTEIKYSSWKDIPFSNYQQGIKEETVISANESTRTTSIAGQQISKNVFLSDKNSSTGQVTYTEKTWDGTEWAIETSVFASNTASGPEAGRPVSTLHADGTVTLYQYAVSGSETTVTTLRGAGSASVVTSGTKNVTTYNQMNEVTFEETSDIESGLQLSFKTGSNFDAVGRAQKWTYNADENDYELIQYSCCGVGYTRDRSGVTKTYSRDALERVYKVVSKSSSSDTSITTNTIFNGLTITTNRTDGTTTLLLSESTHSLGGLTTISKSPDANGDAIRETTISVTVYNATTGTSQTTTHPDGTTTSSQSFLDGSQKSSTDQLGRVTTYGKNTHNLNGGGIVSRMTAANGTQWSESYSDQLGRTFKTLLADGAFSTVTYNPFSAAAGSREKAASSTDSDGITVTYAYNAEGEQTTTTQPMPNGQQSITVTEEDVIEDTFTGTAQRSRTTVNGVLISTSLQSGDGYRTKLINHLANDSISTITRTVPNDGAWTTTSTSPDGTKSVAIYSNGRMSRQESRGSNNSLISYGEMTYDTFDRVTTTIDSRTGTTAMGAYLENGSVTSFTAPGNRTTAFTYDLMGRKITTDAPDTLDADGNNLSNITTTIYDAAGQVTETTGDQTYRVTHTHDALGRQASMTTYGATTATTTWVYSSTRGFLTRKQYHDGKGTDYTYTPAGRIATRTWARSTVATPKVTTYTYDVGMLVETDYSDTTPDVTLNYDNFGRPVNQSNGIATSTFAYNPTTLELDNETVAYNLDEQPGADFTRVIGRSQDNLNRYTGWQLKNGTTVENEVAYNYGAADGRLASVSKGSNLFTYTYVPNSNLIATVTSPVYTVSNAYETDRDVLSSKVNKKLDTTTVSGCFYTVNNFGQRTGVNQDGIAFASTRNITWGYNAKGEVVKADSSISGLDRAYEYEGIGNRLKSADSLTLPTTNNYTPNALNQYTAIEAITPSYDDDGNMTSGPLPANANANSTLVWDGENRLVEAQVNSGATVNYIYDSQSRRIAETFGSATIVYVYDGWNPIAEYSTTYALTKTYTWGLDLSGSIQGAGGVGGLLSVTDGTGTYFSTFDGNGNVSEYLDSTENVAAHYEYDPFGKTTVSNGLKANDFAHRFATKPLDLTTGLYYYGYRFYEPETGRWPSRDPISEKGSLIIVNDIKKREELKLKEDINAYLMVRNNAINKLDIFGLYTLGDAEASLIKKGVAKAIKGKLWDSYSDTQIFDEWLVLERGAVAWVAALPPCPKVCVLAGGKATNPDPKVWSDPNLGPIDKRVLASFHPGAVYELRTLKGVVGSPSGNQCTYDAKGLLLTTAPAAGSADLFGPNNDFLKHQSHDVSTFKLADSLKRVADYYSVRPVW